MALDRRPPLLVPLALALAVAIAVAVPANPRSIVLQRDERRGPEEKAAAKEEARTEPVTTALRLSPSPTGTAACLSRAPAFHNKETRKTTAKQTETVKTAPAGSKSESDSLSVFVAGGCVCLSSVSAG